MAATLVGKTLNNNDLNQVANLGISINNGLLRVLIFAGSEKLVVPIVISGFPTS